jgi:hypothetical protein
MPHILKKSFLKWSTLAVLGVGAYFVGYFRGVQRLGDEKARTFVKEEVTPPQRVPASSQETADLRKLK